MYTNISGIVLAGGKSSRMKKNKAYLTLGDETLVTRQAGKLAGLGCRDIMLSGSGENTAAELPPIVRVIGDEYPQRGPLGGLHACLGAAKCRHCLALGVDVPLVPMDTLQEMVRQHLQSGAEITVLEHQGKWEPLIAVYDTALRGRIEKLIREKGAPVRALLEQSRWQIFSYTGPEEYLMNCNTPEDYRKLVDLWQRLAQAGGEL